MASSPVYREHPVHPATAALVECVWTLRGQPAAGTRQAVLPDGAVDFLFDRVTGTALLVGTMTRCHEHELPPQVDLLGVRFRPGGAHPLLRAPLSAWTDAHQDLAVFGAWARRLTDRVLHAPAATAAADAATALAELAGGADPLREPVQRALAALAAAPGRVRVDDLASAAGVSRQHLTRAVRERCGIAPKALARVLRARRALARLRAGEAAVAVALAEGYADQPHMVRELRSLAGAPPSALLRRDAV